MFSFATQFLLKDKVPSGYFFPKNCQYFLIIMNYFFGDILTSISINLFDMPKSILYYDIMLMRNNNTIVMVDKQDIFPLAVIDTES